MSNEDLQQLKALAMAASEHGEKIGVDEWYSGDKPMSMDPENPDLNFIAAASPIAILALIERIESLAAPAVANGAADERAAFEAWCYDKHAIGGPDRGLKDYANAGTQAVWRAWQARAAIAASTQQAAPNALLVAALKKIIEMNRQTAEDQYGDANKAESWACVTTARAALASVPTASEAT